MVESFAVSLRELNNFGLIGRLLIPSLMRSISIRLLAIKFVIKNFGLNSAIKPFCHNPARKSNVMKHYKHLGA